MSSTRSGNGRSPSPNRRIRPGADPRHILGAQGEARAAEFLEGEGYRIMARNVRAGGVEIDLIVRRGIWWAFVEVKTRRSQRYGRPEEAVDERKQARLVRGAGAWLADHPSRSRRRFDSTSSRSWSKGRTGS